MKKEIQLALTMLLIIMIGCVEPFEIKNTGAGNMLVVEGVFSNQLKRHQIQLSRATSVSERQVVHETGATVTIVDSNGGVITLIEASPGVYETPEVSAQQGSSYTLHIKTSAGSEYQTDYLLFKDGGDIGEVYPKYVPSEAGDEMGVQVYVDTEDPTGQTRFYRWNYTETFEVHSPFPAVWVWIGNNSVEPRWDPIDVCYESDTLRRVVVRSTKDLEKDQVIGQRVRFIPEDSYALRYRYSILVQQFALTEESFNYWENLKEISEEQGSLSDKQPGSLPGNIRSLTNPEETVLGYFEVCKVSEKRIFFSAINFYDNGMKLPKNLRSYCYEIGPLLVPQAQLDDAMTKYQETMHIWDAFGMEPNTTFELMPKDCCDCRDKGPTERPPYF